MNPNHTVLKNFIENGDYTLEDAKARIDYGVFTGSVTAEDAAALITIAEEHAQEPEITTKSLDDRVNDLEMAMLDVLGMIGEMFGMGEEKEMTDEVVEETGEAEVAE